MKKLLELLKKVLKIVKKAALYLPKLIGLLEKKTDDKEQKE